ncbi:hypothetical protein I7I48_03672 [Histoplasma ohiense]|nr:hypothetical protein I7I48_03672 [Histoplasma ohiense (nom. inval.)]
MRERPSTPVSNSFRIHFLQAELRYGSKSAKASRLKIGDSTKVHVHVLSRPKTVKSVSQFLASKLGEMWGDSSRRREYTAHPNIATCWYVRYIRVQNSTDSAAARRRASGHGQ